MRVEEALLSSLDLSSFQASARSVSSYASCTSHVEHVSSVYFFQSSGLSPLNYVSRQCVFREHEIVCKQEATTSDQRPSRASTSISPHTKSRNKSFISLTTISAHTALHTQNTMETRGWKILTKRRRCQQSLKTAVLSEHRSSCEALTL